MYIVTEYSDNYSKTTGSLQQFYRDEPALENNNAIVGFSVDNNNNSNSFIFKQK